MKLSEYIDVSERVVEAKTDKRATYATVYRIDENRVDIRISNSVAIVRHIEVVGDIEALQINDVVQIAWSTGRPVGMASW